MLNLVSYGNMSEKRSEIPTAIGQPIPNTPNNSPENSKQSPYELSDNESFVIGVVDDEELARMIQKQSDYKSVDFDEVVAKLSNDSHSESKDLEGDMESNDSNSVALPADVSEKGGEFHFESKSQYDGRFSGLYVEYPKAQRGMACPIFSLVTANEFLKNKSVSCNKHHENLEKSVNLSAILEISAQKTFEGTVRTTGIQGTDIKATSVHLVRDGTTPLKDIIPDAEYDFAVIVLKNAKFFTVLGDASNRMYHVRDCHELFQYSFLDKESMIVHLNNVYSLNKEFNVDGYAFPEYSSIEYLVITAPFNDGLDEMLERKLLGEPEQNNQINHGVQQPYAGAYYGYPDDYDDHGAAPEIEIPQETVGPGTNPGDVPFARYAEDIEIPDDHVDMMELQRKFGDDMGGNDPYDDMGDNGNNMFKNYIDNNKGLHDFAYDSEGGESDEGNDSDEGDDSDEGNDSDDSFFDDDDL